MAQRKLIVGLGNPGKNYEETLHNLGFLVVQYFAKKYHLKFSHSFLTKSFIAKGTIEDVDVMLLLPLTYMNNSGVALERIVRKMSLELNNLLVVSDDFHLEFGQIRLRAQGSCGGHNGLSSIQDRLGTKDFPRLRCGIGQPPKYQETADYVLGHFTKKEKEFLGQFIEKAAECCLVWMTQGIDKASDQFNGRSPA